MSKLISKSYRTAFDRHARYYTNPGEPIEDVYGLVVDEFGNTIVGVTGKTNTYEYIQSFKDSGNISLILERYKNGDVEALNKVSGFYADVTNMPTSYVDMVAAIQEANKLFDSLPVEIKEKFNFSPGEFFSKYGSDEFVKLVSPEEVVTPVEVVESEDVVDEQK